MRQQGEADTNIVSNSISIVIVLSLMMVPKYSKGALSRYFHTFVPLTIKFLLNLS
jgi:hypothetical protein